jgi:hypothetical protein
MAVAGCVVALITLDARNRQAPTRTLLVVDFSDVTLDFWNAVGVCVFLFSVESEGLLTMFCGVGCDFCDCGKRR